MKRPAGKQSQNSNIDTAIAMLRNKAKYAM